MFFDTQKSLQIGKSSYKQYGNNSTDKRANIRPKVVFFTALVSYTDK